MESKQITAVIPSSESTTSSVVIYNLRISYLVQAYTTAYTTVIPIVKFN